ncbi:hypothetical protein NE237_006612 [Protea cynaroides]|uniref:Myb-like domain-containing protein n=1 Tax=Protea cynaroides TaxID=273540 RepID=A0A9Q0QVH1_9MAGN|nr:hypothetical protein NE237_006612 [Protea cynaroides]
MVLSTYRPLGGGRTSCRKLLIDYFFEGQHGVSGIDIPQKPQASGEAELRKARGYERFVYNTVAELSTGADKEFEATPPFSIPSLSWDTSRTNEEDSRSETEARISLSPDFSEHNNAARVVVQSDETYSLLLDYPRRRPVPVGPDHQAIIPAWGLWGVKKASSDLDVPDPISLEQASYADTLIDDENEKKLMGICIIPMHDSEPSSYSGIEFGSSRIGCACPDGGSIRCVRQHVKEARDRLRGTLGWERFVGLGFCDMGEEVAQRWSEEEEQIFHQVVFSNPASLGKNFWDHLSVVFPSRTRQDIVSYYFNVFMLRKRAEQNRTIPLKIDSDNDEWEGSDDGEEFGMTEDYEDSVVESLVDQEDGYKPEDHEEDFNEASEELYDDDDCDVDGDRGAAEEDEGGAENVLEACIDKSPDGCIYNPTVKLGVTHPHDGGEDHDAQDDSCTSYECQHSGADSTGPVDAGVIMQESLAESGSNKVSRSTYDGLNGVVDHGYGLEPCDAKVWDVGYLTAPKKEVDFLPTCSMIEEVFGEEAWTNMGKDCKRIS